MTYLTLAQIQEMHMLPASRLPKKFKYPEGFFEYILFQSIEEEVNDIFDNISFFMIDEVVEWEKFVRKAGYADLIPFARVDGDDLFCFDKQDSSKIYLVDLSEKPLQEHELTRIKNFYEFINAIRADNDLDPWHPSQVAK
ncbi:MAG TPA: hypothetical protein PL131_14175 [Methylotenera sp.]|nr:hypothetical protein [Methylotenera sp.]HPN02241.1 hypothetical protein [Methylotenera sp.]